MQYCVNVIKHTCSMYYLYLECTSTVFECHIAFSALHRVA